MNVIQDCPIYPTKMYALWTGGHRSLTYRFAKATHAWARSGVDGMDARFLKVSRFGKYLVTQAGDRAIRKNWETWWLFDSCRIYQLPRQALCPCQSLHLRQLWAGRVFVSSQRKTQATAGRAGKGCKWQISAKALRGEDSKFIGWWKHKMTACQKSSTKELIKRLSYSNLLGLNQDLRCGNLKEGTMNAELLEMKRRFPHEVILCRVGEFYEALGFDACVLVEYAGLNPMGGLRSDCVPKAGCPIMNLRQTLDELTRYGFSVCIVEEVKGPSLAKQRKDRFIAGHAHPGSPYVYGLAEADLDLEFPSPIPVVGISRSALGYSVISVCEAMRTLSVEDRLTEEAVVAKLRTKPFQRLYLHNSLRDCSAGMVRWGEHGTGGLLWAECRGKECEWYERDPVSELVSKVRAIFDVDMDVEFRNIVNPPGLRPRSLYVGTAAQIGILPTLGVPSLHQVLLPRGYCNGLCTAYLRDVLLNPPPYHVAASIQAAIHIMRNLTSSIPDFTCVSSAKLVKLIGAKEANHIEFSRIKVMAKDILTMEKDPELSKLINLLLDPTWLATGMHIDRNRLIEDCSILVSKITDILAPVGDPGQAISNGGQTVPDAFFHDFEVTWKGRVNRQHAEGFYTEVDDAAEALRTAVKEDFCPIVMRALARIAPLEGGSGGKKFEIFYSRDNGAVWLKGKRFVPSEWGVGLGANEIKKLKPAYDSKEKKILDFYSTDKVDKALERYRSAVEQGSIAVVEVLKKLSGELQAKLHTIVYVSAFSVIAKALFAHTIEGTRRRWVLPKLLNDIGGEGNTQGSAAEGKFPVQLVDLFPYWLDKSVDSPVLNTVTLSSMWLLTGPNGGGKSSLLRSICAATILASCGLMVPASTAVVPRFDSIMLRMMLSDSPADCKSSFQMEMSELRTILLEATKRSLILVDELCKGTEVSKGTFLVASVLEHLDEVGTSGIISTHLHGLLDMELNTKQIERKAMGTEVLNGEIKPTWRLIDGDCRESLAFETARSEGVPEAIVQRAEKLHRAYIRQQEELLIGPRGAPVNASYPSNSIGKRNLESSERQDQAILGIVEAVNVSGRASPAHELAAVYSEKSSRGLVGRRDLPSQLLFSADSITVCSSERGDVSIETDVSEQIPIKSEGSLQDDDPFQNVKDIFAILCQTNIVKLYNDNNSVFKDTVRCYHVGPRQKPPPSVTNHSCVYVLKRPDGRYYVGQTDNLAGRISAHRSVTEMKETPFLYSPMPNKSVASELESCLINQLPKYDVPLVNKADQHHRHFGTAALSNAGREFPPF